MSEKHDVKKAEKKQKEAAKRLKGRMKKLGITIEEIPQQKVKASK